MKSCPCPRREGV